MTRRYCRPDREVLWGLAAGRCAYPGCTQVCVKEATEHDPTVPVGIAAHIIAHSDTGPRGDPDFPEAARGRYENLILLCPTHHAIVDKQPYTFTSDELRQWKADLEAWVRESLAAAISAVGFAELEVVTEAILSAPERASSDFAVTDPREKMAHNDLTERVHFLLTMGLAKAREVHHYVEGVAAVDPQFPERLKAGFVEEYNRLVAEGVCGDALFEALVDFASQGSPDLKYRAAGLAVLAYLFEKCEVFEK